MIIPKNKILENQYTLGHLLIDKITRQYYIGYYCVVAGNKFYSGKTYSNKSKELVIPD